jgi:hypothetical protein
VSFFNTCGVPIATLALGLSLVATPVMARGGGGGEFHGGGGGFHGGGFHGGGGSAWRGGGGGWRGGYGGWGGGYGEGYGYGGAALGLGLLGGAIIGSQYPYYGSGYASYPQDGGGVSSASCASRFKSYNPASGDVPRIRRLAAYLPVSSPNGLSVTSRSSATGSPLLVPLRA